MSTPDIIFPHLGIELERVSRIAFSIGSVNISWYGIFICAGILAGAAAAFANTKRNGLSNELFTDFVLWVVPIAMVCTRLYYVAFNFDLYRDNPLKILEVWKGGMGVYGGIISGIIVCVVFARARKIKIGALGDTGVFGLLAGQIIGRIGNLVNQEAFGGYTDGLFAMQLKLENVSSAHVTDVMRDNMVVREAVQYIQVHPTFLYEMALNAVIFIGLWAYRKHKSFTGELLTLYVVLYALGRFFIESLRTDQLILWGTDIPVSMAVSAILFTGGAAYYAYRRVRAAKEPKDQLKAEDAIGEEDGDEYV